MVLSNNRSNMQHAIFYVFREFGEMYDWGDLAWNVCKISL